DPRRGKIIEKLFERFVEARLIQPTYVILYPRDISPLARPYRNDPNYSERFELFVKSLEIGNGYSELNNPIVQYFFFKKEEDLRLKSMHRTSEVEYHPMDRDYVRALEYGMPPTAGVGIGIYRLIMILSGLPSIKDVIPFSIVELDEFKTVAENHEDVLRYYIENLQLDRI
ncbi:MAG: amino acid--tRNA ligase-related protein, partial [Ignisphaera sp.]